MFNGIKWYTAQSIRQIPQEWTHLAGTFNGTSVCIYVNGKIEQCDTLPETFISIRGNLTTTKLSNLTSDSDVVIGAYVNGLRDKVSNQFNGLIDNVELYNSFLQLSQIDEIYNKNTPKYQVVALPNATIPIFVNSTSQSNGTRFSDETTDDGLNFTIQHNEIEINKPVTWIANVTLDNEKEGIKVELPADVRILDVNASMDEINSSKKISIIPTSSNESIPLVSLGKVPNITEKDGPTKFLMINETAKQYQIEFQTTPPYVIEQNQSTPESYLKKVTVMEDSPLNYTNIKSYSEIPEELVAKGLKFRLYWLQNDTYLDVTNDTRFHVQLTDTNNNLIPNRIEWIVPHLSQQQFLILSSLPAPDATFHGPSGIALDSSGNIYLADRANNRIEIFNSSEVFVRQFGVAGFDPDGPGPLQAPPGTFNNPTGIAVDKFGNIYVSDSGNNRVEVFNSTGTFKGQIGRYGIDPDGAGPLQAPNGTFYDPIGITINKFGNLFVADSGNNRIEVFNLLGGFKSAFGTFGIDPDGPGPLQAPNGTFNDPSGVAVDSSLNVYVTDSGNNRIEVFNLLGGFKSAFGTFGIDPDGPGPLQAPNGTFNDPAGIAVDDSGNTYVVDKGNSRIEVFDSTGVFKKQIGKFGIDPDGPGPLQAPISTLYNPTSVAVDSSLNVYVADANNDRTEVFDSTGTFESTFGTFGISPDAPIPLPPPAGIAVNDLGDIYVADSGSNIIDKFNTTGIFTSKFGSFGFDPDGPGSHLAPDGTFNTPTNIADDSLGNTYVTDSKNNRIEVFSPSGVFVRQFGTFGIDPDGPGPLQAPNGTLSYPSGVSVDSSFNVYVADSKNNRIEVFSPSGVFVRQFGTFGIDPDGPGPLQAPNGTFNDPAGIAVDDSGNTYVVDSGNYRIEIFDSTGTFKRQIGQYGIDPDGAGPLQAPNGTFYKPLNIALDHSNNIYVVDSVNSQIEIFDSAGSFKKAFGSSLIFKAPTGVAVDDFGNIYVSDNGNTRIQKFDPSERLLFAIETLRAGGTGKAVFSSDVTVGLTLPSTVSGTVLFTNSTASTNTGNSNTVFRLLQVTDISVSNGASCLLGCTVTFKANQTVLNAAGLIPQDFKILHDQNNDNDFKDVGEQLTTTITHGPSGIYTATATTNSNSNFAIGMNSTVPVLISLDETMSVSDAVTTAKSLGHSTSLDETMSVSDAVTTAKSLGHSTSLDETMSVSDAVTTAKSLGPSTSLLRFGHDVVHVTPPSIDSITVFPILEGNEIGFGGKLLSSNTTAVFETGNSVRFRLLLEEDKGAETISHVALYTNIRGNSSGIYDSDTHVTYEKFQSNEIIDPHGFFSKVNISTVQIDATILQVNFDITLAKEMKKTDVIARVWTLFGDSYDTRIINALAVKPAAEPTLTTSETSTNLSEIKDNAKRWALGQASEADFAKNIYVLIDKGLIKETQTISTSDHIPSWVKNNAKWWADEKTSDDEFMLAIQWLIDHGVITISQ
ncbi:MAG: hypothetical protein HY223_00055 [Thaumarchaeota archaeon]|nr:hypothetical protein [Nitrososphaerota archaeon]